MWSTRWMVVVGGRGDVVTGSWWVRPGCYEYIHWIECLGVDGKH